MAAEERVNAMPLHWLPPPCQGVPDMTAQYREIVKLVREAVAEEREACAEEAETSTVDFFARQAIAAAIRARGKTDASTT